MEVRKDFSHELAAPHFVAFPTPEEIEVLLMLAGDEENSIQKIARVIGGRPMVSAAIMQAVNSVSTGTGRQIRSLRHALAMMGLERVREILIDLQQKSIQEHKRNPSGKPVSRVNENDRL